VSELEETTQQNVVETPKIRQNDNDTCFSFDNSTCYNSGMAHRKLIKFTAKVTVNDQNWQY